MHKENDLNREIQNKLAEAYCLSLSSAIKRGMRYKRKHGEWCHKAPYGYQNIHDNADRFKPKIVKDPEHYRKIKKAFELMLTEKYSVAEVSRIVKMNASLVRRAFRNPFYAGLSSDIDDPKIMHKGNWEPMITEDQFNKVQKLLKPKKKLNGATA